MAAPQPDQDSGRHEVVQRGVREIGGHAQEGVLRQEPVEPALRVQVHQLLAVQDVGPVPHGVAHVASDEEANAGVEGVDDGYERQFGPCGEGDRGASRRR